LGPLANKTQQHWALSPTTPEPNSVFGQELRLETLFFLPKVLGLALQLDPTLLGLIAKLSPKHFQQVSVALGPAIMPEGGVPLLCFFFFYQELRLEALSSLPKAFGYCLAAGPNAWGLVRRPGPTTLGGSISFKIWICN
jgi:hypothetical protein